MSTVQSLTREIRYRGHRRHGGYGTDRLEHQNDADAPGGTHAVLLFHGLRSTPQEMAYLARRLSQEGFDVLVPYIDGYSLGSECTTSQAWREAAREHFRSLKATHERVSVAGLCIGASLALALAADEQDVDSLSLLSTTLDYDGWNIPWYHFLLDIAYHTPFGRFYSMRERMPYGLKNLALRAKVERSMKLRGASDAGAASLPMKYIYEAHCLARYVKQRLPDIRASCLLMHAIDDDTATTANADRVFDHIGSTFKRKILLDDSYHIITMDNERELVARETQWFFEEAAALVE